MPEKKQLSGKAWWHANQRRYPNSNRLEDLEPGFRSRVERFLHALREAGATVVVASTLRDPIRAYLMHFSWKIAHGSIDPSQVPRKSGVVIDWDHGDDDASREAAMEMVNLFRMRHIASLTSNHTRGKAIDMNVTWKNTLVLKLPNSRLWELADRPRDGQNRELHRVGAEFFGVHKLKSDPPHWSHDGR